MEDHRKDDATVIELLRIMRSLTNDFNGHAKALMEIDHKLDTILTAFPAGGLVEHRLVHERMMASDKINGDLRASVTKNVISGGVWATLVIVAYALWEYLKIKARL